MTRIAVSFGSGTSPTDIVECVKLAEDLGYESAWVIEGHGGDQFSILTACAVQTNRIQLGTAISSVFVRSAPTIAMAAACVDYYSNQRMILGLGSSHKVQVEPEHGLTFEKPIQRVRETVEVIRTLLREGSVSHEGETVSIERFDLWFKPIREEIPIYLSAVFPRMLEVCGEIAQGTILAWSNLDHGTIAAQHLATGARRAGRSLEDVDVTSCLFCSVSEDRQEALDRIRPTVAFYVGFFPRYRRLMEESGHAEAGDAIRAAWLEGDRAKAARLVPDALVEEVSIAGTPSECRERLEAYRASGIALPIIGPVTDSPDNIQPIVAAIRACAP